MNYVADKCLKFVIIIRYKELSNNHFAKISKQIVKFGYHKTLINLLYSVADVTYVVQPAEVP